MTEICISLLKAQIENQEDIADRLCHNRREIDKDNTTGYEIHMNRRFNEFVYR